MSRIESSTIKFKVEKFNGKGNFGYGKRGWRRCWCNKVFTRSYRVSQQNLRYVKRELEGDGFKGGKHDPTMSRRWGYVQRVDEETVTGLWSKLETLYIMKSLSNKLYLKKQLYGLRMKEGSAVLEHLNFFNKVISELLTVDIKIDEKDKALILLSLFQSHMIISSPPYSTVKKLSSWRRSCQLSYLMRLEKGQIKRSI